MNIFDIFKDEGLPIIIFGAGVVGEALFHACFNAGIKVECFCDNNVTKVHSSLCGIEVIHVPDLKTRYADAHFLISAADIGDVVDQLHDLGYTKWYACSLLLRNFDISQHPFNAPTDFLEYAIATCLLCHDSYLTPDKLFLRSVDLIITERCSLKCKDCSNLMQYYRKPTDCSSEELLGSIDKFCSVVDEVNEFRVIGGEPFMNKDFHLVVGRLVDEPKVRRIVIYTNGTIVPKERNIECLNSKKVLLIITDYGDLSKKLNDLIQVLQLNNIAYYANKAHGWTDCANIVRHNRNFQQQKELFRSCCTKNTVTLSKGKLYRCPFSANADRLRAVPDFENDHFDIFQRSQDSNNILEMKKRIRPFLLEKYFLQVCDFCNGRPFGAPEIIPAVQINKPLEYEQYG